MSDAAAPAAPERGRPRVWINLLLFLATCLTTTWAGVLYVHPELGPRDLRALSAVAFDGLPYSIALMAILLAHEMGHYLFARRHGLRASLPYFLPVPLPTLGTMGAVILMKGRIGSRNALVDWAAAGPLAGLAVAIPVLIIGLSLSPVAPQAPGLLEGNNLLYLLLKLVVKGQILPGGGMDVQLHPTAWAGWVGLLVTMINLIPVGQLDGGHIAFAFFQRRYEKLSYWMHQGLLLLAAFGSGYTVLELSRKLPWRTALILGGSAGFSWLVWWLLLKLMKKASGGRYHPAAGEEELTPGRRRLCWLMIIVFFLVLIPIPLRPTM